MKNAIINKNDIFFQKGENNKVLVLNRETGNWYVGYDKNNVVR